VHRNVPPNKGEKKDALSLSLSLSLSSPLTRIFSFFLFLSIVRFKSLSVLQNLKLFFKSFSFLFFLTSTPLFLPLFLFFLCFFCLLVHSFTVRFCAWGLWLSTRKQFSSFFAQFTTKVSQPSIVPNWRRFSRRSIEWLPTSCTDTSLFPLVPTLTLLQHLFILKQNGVSIFWGAHLFLVRAFPSPWRGEIPKIDCAFVAVSLLSLISHLSTFLPSYRRSRLFFSSMAAVRKFYSIFALTSSPLLPLSLQPMSRALVLRR